MRRRGRFVVFEGLDGAGTSTQAALLAEALRRSGYRVLLTREPSDGPLGMLIRQVLQERLRLPSGGRLSDATLALLFAADRLDHLAATVEPALAAGMLVISDRYLLSSLAYQGRTLDPGWVEHLNARAPPPDLTLYLEVHPRTAARRRRRRGGRPERFEDARTQGQVASAYGRLLARHARTQRVVRLDGEQTVADLAAEVLASVVRRVGPRPRRSGRRVR